MHKPTITIPTPRKLIVPGPVKRNYTRSFRMTDDEWDCVVRASGNLNLSISEYIRWLLVHSSNEVNGMYR